ncbi:metallophosphoesterase [Pseudoalteromonas sp. T1lg65]|uniref:metallophosphoesterase n=1 Tax=Pseudoalteromonas sp. T1lg65 TaxID=2077101 RepID=UPI003F7AEC1F
MNKFKWMIVCFSTVVVTFVLLIVILLSRAYFITDKNGLYQYLVIPIFGDNAANIRLYTKANIGRDINVQKEFFGPIFRLNDKNERIAYWVCDNQTFSANTLGAEQYQIQCNDKTHSYNLTKAQTNIPDSIEDKEVYAFSDLHGNISYFKRVLTNLGVIDANGNWSFASNGIVLTGDFIDKTSDDRALMWFIYELERQAAEQGGFVLSLLGNHEIFQLQGDYRHAHPVSTYLTQKMLPLTQALDNKTVLGRWLREKAVIAELDGNLFVHAGLSPVLLDIDDIQSLNHELHAYWQGKTLSEVTYASIFGAQGVVNYRGMIKATSFYPALTQQQFDELTELHGFKKVIFGHTEVEQVSFLFDGKAIAIDASRHSSQVLKLKAEQQILVDVASRNQNEAWKTSAKQIPFNLFVSNDWLILVNGVD